MEIKNQNIIVKVHRGCETHKFTLVLLLQNLNHLKEKSGHTVGTSELVTCMMRIHATLHKNLTFNDNFIKSISSEMYSS